MKDTSVEAHNRSNPTGKLRHMQPKDARMKPWEISMQQILASNRDCKCMAFRQKDTAMRGTTRVLFATFLSKPKDELTHMFACIKPCCVRFCLHACAVNIRIQGCLFKESRNEKGRILQRGTEKSNCSCVSWKIRAREFSGGQKARTLGTLCSSTAVHLSRKNRKKFFLSSLAPDASCSCFVPNDVTSNCLSLL